MSWFRNHYRCARCGHEWTDQWSAMCEDDCPHCGARHMSPYQSDDVQPEPIGLLKDIAATFRRINGTAENFGALDKLAMLQEYEDAVFAIIEDASEADAKAAVLPSPPRTEVELRIAVELLKNARDRVRRANCPRTLKKINSAIKSAEGAQRHLNQRQAAGARR